MASNYVVNVTDDNITCPACSVTINLVKNKGVGATYAKEWSQLPSPHTKFLKIWNDSDISETWVTKDQLWDLIDQDIPSFKKRVPFNGRISEILGAGTRFGEPLIEKTKDVKESYSHTTKGPFYRLNKSRVNYVLQRGGMLSQEL
jgi:hypothetical protein